MGPRLPPVNLQGLGRRERRGGNPTGALSHVDVRITSRSFPFPVFSVPHPPSTSVSSLLVGFVDCMSPITTLPSSRYHSTPSKEIARPQYAAFHRVCRGVQLLQGLTLQLLAGRCQLLVNSLATFYVGGQPGWPRLLFDTMPTFSSIAAGPREWTRWDIAAQEREPSPGTSATSRVTGAISISGNLISGRSHLPPVVPEPTRTSPVLRRPGPSIFNSFSLPRTHGRTVYLDQPAHLETESLQLAAVHLHRSASTPLAPTPGLHCVTSSGGERPESRPANIKDRPQFSPATCPVSNVTELSTFVLVTPPTRRRQATGPSPPRSVSDLTPIYPLCAPKPTDPLLPSEFPAPSVVSLLQPLFLAST
ncbi:hypothetical protein CMUS01_13822 [Colletotrichum musicola]|uniref:Uncharacterized protein n=1 Tax=Colletotrichum musicola TaxID=2175873 RepID=A0A8H6MUJ3_9PEZI|nr:hypothetical protein CMUS01_13822 [Colletotrichum musicola]